MFLTRVSPASLLDGRRIRTEYKSTLYSLRYWKSLVKQTNWFRCFDALAVEVTVVSCAWPIIAQCKYKPFTLVILWISWATWNAENNPGRCDS
jgi:hypothetical protein